MDKPNIVITRKIAQPAIEQLRAIGNLTIWPKRIPPSSETLLKMVTECAALLCLLTDRIDENLLVAAPHLRVVSTMSVGYEHIDIEGCRKRGIHVGHTPGILTETTADFTIALILSVARRIPEAADFARSGEWQTWEPELLLGQDLGESTIGIVGLGRVGQAVARRAFAFGSRLLYHDTNRDIKTEEDLKIKAVPLDELLIQSDIVTLHVPLTETTHHLIGSSQLEMMKPTAILINTSRGSVVHIAALLQALQEGKITAAGLDVTDPEPLPHNHPLYQLPNCLITPHIASAGATTRTKMALMAVDNLLAGLEGRPLPHPVT